MDQLQRELAADGVDVTIIGVNDEGFESGNDSFCDGVDLPWLQNTPEVDAWNLWAVAYRDVVIVDATGHRAHTFNVTEHDLSQPDRYEALRSILIDVAGR